MMVTMYYVYVETYTFHTLGAEVAVSVQSVSA